MMAPVPTERRLLLRRPIVSFDLETTGLDPAQDRVVEICCLKLGPDGKRDALVYRVNPGQPIAKAATAVHGITDADVADKPPFAAIAEAVWAFCQGADLTGFNIERFDIPLLRAEFQRLGKTFPAPFTSVIDSCRIFFQREPRNLTAALQFYCGRKLEGAHGALADATAALDVLLGQVARYEDLPQDVFALHEVCHPRRPDWIDAEGKVVWHNGAAALSFGKHRNKPLADLVGEVPDYLRWIANDSNFSSEVKSICHKALMGQFPTASAAATEASAEPAMAPKAAEPAPKAFSFAGNGKGQGSLF